MKLTKAQQRALSKMDVDCEYSAYDLGESISTLDALVKKGYLTREAGLGAIYSPRVNIMYKLVKH